MKNHSQRKRKLLVFFGYHLVWLSILFVQSFLGERESGRPIDFVAFIPALFILFAVPVFALLTAFCVGMGWKAALCNTALSCFFQSINLFMVWSGDLSGGILGGLENLRSVYPAVTAAFFASLLAYGNPLKEKVLSRQRA